jgi:hypothetical protein
LPNHLDRVVSFCTVGMGAPTAGCSDYSICIALFTHAQLMCVDMRGVCVCVCVLWFVSHLLFRLSVLGEGMANCACRPCGQPTLLRAERLPEHCLKFT